MSRRITVVGAGVIGLTTAIALQEVGHDVEIVADGFNSQTTSGHAGAIWGPFLSKLDDRLAHWSNQTLDVLRKLATSVDETGVQLVAGLGVERDSQQEPWWVESFQGAVEISTRLAPVPCTRAWRYTVPIIDIPRYLSYLRNRFHLAGGQYTHATVKIIDDLAPTQHIIVCAGMGARRLLQDRQLTESRGRLVVVTNPGITDFHAERGDGPELTYILPQGPQVVLGGTAEPTGVHLGSDEAVARGIIDRCAAVVPLILSSQVISIRSAMRPCRPEVRLHHEIRGNMHLIHNYGHGGSGVSVSWGCAESVKHLINTCPLQ